MKIFLYDSSFEGLLTSIYDAYYSCNRPDKIYKEKIYTPNLIDETLFIKTDLEKFNKVYNAIKNKISKNTLNKVYYCYLSNNIDSANIIYSYLKMGFKIGANIDLHKHNDIVIRVDSLSKKVSFEKHRFTGFVRFKEVNNILYSSIEPDHNILPLLGSHFENRLKNEYFIINDTRRDIALIYDKKNYYIKKLNSNQKKLLNNTIESTNYEDLWKQYFTSTNISERKNSKLQKRQMPIRYWKNLTELK